VRENETRSGKDPGKIGAWADRLLAESEKQVETWRAPTTDPAADISPEEAEKTHALMLSVLELMRIHRISLAYATGETARGQERDSDC